MCRRARSVSGRSRRPIRAYLQARVKALAKCNAGIIKGSIVACPDAKTQGSLDKALGKLTASINKSCGGDDQICTGDTLNEPTAAQLGWPSQCPNFEKGECREAVKTCADILDCLTCIGDAAVDQEMTLLYGSLDLSNTTDKALDKCQTTIGKAATAFQNTISKVLQKCWDAKINGKHSGDCFQPSAGDGKYANAITKAETKMKSSICGACGGADKACDGTNDISPTTIGFPDDCSRVAEPHGGDNCFGPITDLDSLVTCVDCVTQFKGNCVDNLQVPQLTPYPAECNSCTLDPPTGACPTSLTFTAEGQKVDLDTGFTGLAHDAKVPTNGRITLNITGCTGVAEPTCGQCNVNGPIDNPGGVTFNNHRCQDASWVQVLERRGLPGGHPVCRRSEQRRPLHQRLGLPEPVCRRYEQWRVLHRQHGVSGRHLQHRQLRQCRPVGPCIYFFGAPLPLRAGGVSTCIVNEINGPVTGTINLNDGTSINNVPLSSKVYPVGGEFNPCPRCIAGTCENAGPRATQACTVNGASEFGDVSLDCPPNPGSLAAKLAIDLNIATGTQTKTVTTANPTCRQTGFNGLRCLCDTCNTSTGEACSTNVDCPTTAIQCLGGTNSGALCADPSECPGGFCGGGPGICGGRRCQSGTEDGKPCSVCLGGTNHGANCSNQTQCPLGTCSVGCAGGGTCGRAGEPTQPNACTEDTNTPDLDCEDGGNNEGFCATGPVDGPLCSIQTFHACVSDTDCDPAGACGPNCLPNQVCTLKPRPCFLDNGKVGNTVAVSGFPDAPCGGIAKPTVGTFFCVAPTIASAVNSAGGLPALGRVRIPGIVEVFP